MHAPVATAQSIYPTLTPNGFRPLSFAPDDMQSFSAPRVAQQLRTAFEYLADHRPPLGSRLNIGEIRHAAAWWGRCNGGANYILEGPVIVALVCLGISFEVDDEGFAYLQ